MSILPNKTPIDEGEKQTIEILESLGFWWGDSPISTEKQLTNIIDNTYMRFSKVKEDGSMSFSFESIGEFSSAWWQTLTMDEVKGMVREIDGNTIDDNKTKSALSKLGFDLFDYYAHRLVDIEVYFDARGNFSYVAVDGLGMGNKGDLQAILSSLNFQEDTPITPEFLEGLGFEALDEEMLFSTQYYDLVSRGKGIFVITNNILAMSCVLPHIRTQQQLLNLITALFGEVGGE